MMEEEKDTELDAEVGDITDTAADSTDGGEISAEGEEENSAPAPRGEELVKLVLNDPEAKKRLGAVYLAELSKKQRDIPTLNPSSGASTSPAIVPEPPQSLKEAKARAFKALGI